MSVEEIRIDKLFDAKAYSILKTFTLSGGNTGFSIPLYQRIYRWGEDAINRLVLSIIEGISALRYDPNSISFIGTIICVDETKTKPGFDGRVLSIVDGQQRLTTISLLCCLLHQKLNRDMNLIINAEISDLFKTEYKIISKKLLAPIAGTYDDFGSGYENHFPKIIRDKVDDWNIDEREYSSPVSNYIFQYIKHLYKNDNDAFEFNPLKEDEPHQYFSRNIDILNCSLDEVFCGLFETQSEDTVENISMPTYEDLTGNERFKNALLPHLEFNSENKKLIKKNEAERELINGLLNLFSFANFLLDRVALTSVIATDDKYAFDIFEALNTTGEPLTAIETLKPFVVIAEDENKPIEGGYFRSKSKVIFDNIEQYLDNKEFPEAKHKQKESSEIVISFALLYDGKKESGHLGAQRNYLRSRYEALTYTNKCKFMATLDNFVDYKRKFWIADNLNKQLINNIDREIILFCLDFIRSMKNTMAIPPLARYHAESVANNINDYFEAVKSVTAFLVIWRAYFGATASIDSKYRELMTNGCKSITGSKPVCHGKAFKNALPSINELKINLKKFLEDKNLLDKNTWIEGVIECPMYDKCRLVAKFMLLVSAHNTGLKNDSVFLLEKERHGAHKQYISLNQWRSDDYKTLEHVAPQKPENKEDWDKKIYQMSLLGTVGNLTLLPEKENSTVGNYGWDRKKIYYKAFSEEKLSNIDNYIAEAKELGVDFGKKTIQMIKSGACLPTISYIANVENWTAEVIQQRSKNIAELVWDEIITWLD